jgi:class 3 adenylate cyclase
VSVLFADIPGFTALSERLDPEQVSEIMHRMFDIVLRVVHEHGGRVNQFLGDGVMALFGEAPAEFRVRMAINTGPVVVGTIGAALRTDYTATGRTRELATGRYDFEDLGEMPLTESLETVAVYALTRETMKYVQSSGLATV